MDNHLRETCLLIQAIDVCIDQPATESLSALDAYTRLERLLSKDKNLMGDWQDGLDEFLSEAEHWRDGISGNLLGFSWERAAFLLDSWLIGLSPPPRCHAMSVSNPAKRCLEYASKHSNYCVRFHVCRLCPLPRFQDIEFCDEHRCKAANIGDDICTSKRFKHSMFCADHSCRACIILECGKVNQRDGPEACQDHQCAVNLCERMRVSPQPFCELHCCVICLKSGILANSPRIDSSSFCSKHKCKYPRCLKGSCAPSSFCYDHTCRACTDPTSLNAIDELCPGPKLCSEHRCAYPETECEYMRFPQSLFCISHTCRVCLEVSTPPYCKSVLSEVPRNVCIDHTLCAFVYSSGNTCLKVALEGSSYCEKHDEDHKAPQWSITSLFSRKAKAPMIKGDGQCCGINKKKKRCGAKGSKSNGGRWYCPAHVGQDAENEDADDADDADEDYEADEAEVRNSLLSRQPEVDIQLHWVQCSSVKLREGRCGMRKFDADLAGSNVTWLCPIHAEPLPSNSLPEAVESSEGILPSGIQPLASSQSNRSSENVKMAEQSSVGARDGSEDEHNMAIQERGHRLDDDEEEDDILPEGIAGDVNPDELDMDAFGFPEEVNYNVARLKEIDNEEDSFDDGGSEEGSFEMHSVHSTRSIHEILHLMSWSTSWNQRVAVVVDILHCCSNAIDDFREKAEEHVAEGRRRRLEANASGFKASQLIGATVVGAARRLDAIRAAEPFAVLVEEACEVMEPTLVSVLAVKSLRKLELIGDHRQLPAFVQPSWYNFERTSPTIKISVFERLITDSKGNDGHQVAHTILDEQRRMRTEIADITRVDYVDVVQIKDHPKTMTQEIGDHLPETSTDYEAFHQHKKLWCQECKYSPGVLTNIFFWDVKNNVQGRPMAGLSACNYIEANHVVQLTAWLLLCGVPPSSISIITPYKGQKMLLLKELRKANCLPQFDKKLGAYPNDGIIVNTVDRYQGDENDVIILSLVRTSPGNRFIGLENRFIVATSRARIAFFVIGSVNAVAHRDKALKGDGPQHWRRFINSLSAGQGNDKSRIGESLMVCCPRHSTSTLKISDPKAFPTRETWAMFCNFPCDYSLPECGHKCQELCHAPWLVPHTMRCMHEVPRPCKEHADFPLRCCNALGTFETLELGLKAFKCEVLMPHDRPECSHSVQLRCHELQSLRAGRLKLAECEEPVDDYVHPVCGHVFSNMICKTRRAYEQTPPSCKIKVPFVRPCGCQAKISCCNILSETGNPMPCKKEKTYPRPRCGHNLSMRCFQGSELLSQWEKLNAVSAEVDNGVALVEIGTSYGPPESMITSLVPKCGGKAEVQLLCGHVIEDVPCDIAFQFAVGQRALPLCEAEVAMESLLCSHKVNVPCFVQKLLEDVPPLEIMVGESCRFLRTQIMEQCKYNQLSKSTMDALRTMCQRCNLKSFVIPACDPSHCFEIRCNEILDYAIHKKEFKDCRFEFNRRLSCGHDRCVPCYTRHHREPPCRTKVDDVVFYPCGQHIYFPGTCSNLKAFKNEDEQGRLKCPEMVDTFHFRCGHPAKIPCSNKSIVVGERIGARIGFIEGIGEAVESGAVYCDVAEGIPRCIHQPVAFKRSCSHVMLGLPCHKAFEYAVDESLAPVCTVPLQLQSPLCGHKISPACHLHVAITAWRPWENDELPQFDQMVQRDDSVIEVLHHRRLQPKPLPQGIVRADLDCCTPIIYVRECGMHEMRVTCAQALLDEFPPCSEKVL